MGLAHKSEAGAVRLNLQNTDEITKAAKGMTGVSGYLIEEMVTSPVAEVLIGITRDATGLMLLTIGSGGVMTELLEDTASIVVPATRTEIANEISGLKLFKLLDGFRGKPKADMEALLDAVEAVQNYCLNTSNLIELDINPLMALEEGAIAVDALIKLEKNQ